MGPKPDFTAMRARALHHLRVLSETIGPRPPTSPAQRRAVMYVAQVLREAGIEQQEWQPFRAARYTYWPYFFTFLAGVVGNLLAWRGAGRLVQLLAAGLNAAAARAFLAQTDFEPNWARRLTPHGQGVNLIARVPAQHRARHRLVLMAHLDTHKTPWPYRSPGHARLFSRLITLAFLSFLAATGVGLWRAWHPRGLSRRWQGLFAAMQGLMGLLTAQAETTPYSPGAHDNASGVAGVLALAEHLARHPFPHTEVWLVFTDCEEVGAYGALALVERYAEDLREAVFLNLDMIGMGYPAVQLVDGLVRRHRVHPGLWERLQPLFRERPHWYAREEGGAYTDTTPLTKLGYQAITITVYLPQDHPAAARNGYWHQLDDRPEHIEPQVLQACLEMTWTLMEHLVNASTEEDAP